MVRGASDEGSVTSKTDHDPFAQFGVDGTPVFPPDNPWIKHFIDEFRREQDRIERLFARIHEHNNRLIVLVGATLGLIVPQLSSAKLSHVDWMLRRAVHLLVFDLALAVLLQFMGQISLSVVSRFIIDRQRKVGRKLNEALAAGNVANAILLLPDDAKNPPLRVKSLVLSMRLIEVAFYALFAAAAWYMARAF
jgi:hypothetical protein